MMRTEIRWGLAFAATILAQISLIALSIICVVVYSYGIHTGETPEYYSAFAQTSGPWVSLIAGGPTFFLIARRIRRRAQSAALATAMGMAGFYLVIEVAVFLLWPGDVSSVLPFMIAGMLLKTAGAWLGAGGTGARALADSAA